MTDRYESPLTGRYASKRMSELFSQDVRYTTWRKLWVSLAEAEKELGLNISDEQIKELKDHICDIDYDAVRQREKEVRHDVMAHVYVYGLAAPAAKGIIHLGATSCYVTDNGDLIIYRQALSYIREDLLKLMKELGNLALRYKDLPALAYTHYQPAQPTTMSKRFSLWLQDLYFDLQDLDHVKDGLKFLGCRGTTGSEASFMDLFEGDEEKIDRMNARIAEDFGFKAVYDLSSQTYPRKIDAKILFVLSSIAQSAYKMAQDIRLLQHDGELEEPFEDSQIGSSAMAYKRNPMRCERVCSLARYLINDAGNACDTAAVQWLERSLDDSANRRLSMPEAFLCADGILSVLCNIIEGLKVNEKIVEKRIKDYLPFIATENIMMEAVRKGKDRQIIHEIIRRDSMKVIKAKQNGEEADLLALLIQEEELGLNEKELKNILEPKLYTGRCARQTEHFVAKLQPLFEGVKEEKTLIEV